MESASLIEKIKFDEELRELESIAGQSFGLILEILKDFDDISKEKNSEILNFCGSLIKNDLDTREQLNYGYLLFATYKVSCVIHGFPFLQLAIAS